MTEHSQWRHFDAKGKITTQSRKDPSAPFVADVGGSAFSALVAEGRNRVLGEELTEVGGRKRADLFGKATERGVDAWRQY